MPRVFSRKGSGPTVCLSVVIPEDLYNRMQKARRGASSFGAIPITHWVASAIEFALENGAGEPDELIEEGSL